MAGLRARNTAHFMCAVFFFFQAFRIGEDLMPGDKKTVHQDLWLSDERFMIANKWPKRFRPLGMM